MDKYSVKIDEEMNKHGSQGECPACGASLVQQTNPPKCPRCGTEPFEARQETNKQDGRT